MGELGCGDNGMACKGKAPRAVRMDTHLQTEPLFGGPHNHRGFGGVEQFKERWRQPISQRSWIAVGLDDLQELDRGHEDVDSTTVEQLDDGAALDCCVLAMLVHGVMDDAADVGRRTHEHWHCVVVVIIVVEKRVRLVLVVGVRLVGGAVHRSATLGFLL